MSLLTARRNLPALASVALVCALLTPDVAAECPAVEEGVGAIESTSIRAVTLNVAHGRKDGRNQMLLGEETIRSNLVEVADFLDRSEADVIALQEVDAESKWSGTFNHLDFLSDNSAYVCSYHGLHASGRLYDFGTALLAQNHFAIVSRTALNPPGPPRPRVSRLPRLIGIRAARCRSRPW